jgi:ribose 5-phosphate isomerase A
MEWTTSETGHVEWRKKVSNFDAKARIAKEMASRLHDGDVVGVGSGSTSFMVLQALGERARKNEWHFTAITTSLEMEISCHELHVRTSSLLQQRPDWSFDGADEIDGALNMIKGRGGAMLRERLVLSSSPERYIVVDESKRVERLGVNVPIPVEIVPESFNLVRSRLLESFQLRHLDLRLAVSIDGPAMTENGNLILDVGFDNVQPELDSALNSIPGVVGTGLFIGFGPTVISA